MAGALLPFSGPRGSIPSISLGCPRSHLLSPDLQEHARLAVTLAGWPQRRASVHVPLKETLAGFFVEIYLTQPFACSHEDALLVMHEGPLQVSIGCVLTTDTWPFGTPLHPGLTPVGC